jgi:hypothetical protein
MPPRKDEPPRTALELPATTKRIRILNNFSG